jgi:hypothetical protein
VTEALLAAWLAASPFVLGSSKAAPWPVLHDLVVAALLAAPALLSLRRRWRRAHLLELPVALWLTGFGWVRHATAPTAAAQNHMLLGLVVLMLAILPSEASRPPLAWRPR